MVKKITKSKIIDLYLNDYSKKYYLRELASLISKPHQSIKPYIETLIKENILIKDERKNITEYSLNFKNPVTKDYLIIAEKEKLIIKLGSDTLLKILFEKLYPYFDKSTFIIFGSSVNILKKESDIDILIISRKDTLKIKKIITDFENIYNKKIHLIQITNIEKLSQTLAIEIYKKHLIFNNTEKIIRFFGDLYEKNRLV